MKNIYLSIFSLIILNSCTNTISEPIQEKAEAVFQSSLAIPALLEDLDPEEGKAHFQFSAQEGEVEFFKEFKSKTLGYNGNYLGPTIRVQKGDDVSFEITNTLNEATTVHWHGAQIPGEMDGGPHQVIKAGETWKPYFKIIQKAATIWYHPHLMNTTAEQAYFGLAGLFIIEDEESKNLDIPQDYGVNDIPLVVQDRYFNEQGQIEYLNHMMAQIHGMFGNTVLVNGVVHPYQEVSQDIVRFRILNGSNARQYNFFLSNNQPFFQIASDGGFLEKPVERSEISLAPGERVEVLIDFSSSKIGDKIILKSNADDNFDLMEFRVTKASQNNFQIPKKLVEIVKLKEEDVTQTRKFVIETMSRSNNGGGSLLINSKNMDINRIDETVELGATEIWEIYNQPMGMMNMPHPFHIHSLQFQILDRDGKAPALYEQGWKDVVNVKAGERVRIIAKFTPYEGVFMYHCHNLEHEDGGMMGQFEIKKAQN